MIEPSIPSHPRWERHYSHLLLPELDHETDRESVLVHDVEPELVPDLDRDIEALHWFFISDLDTDVIIALIIRVDVELEIDPAFAHDRDREPDNDPTQNQPRLTTHCGKGIIPPS